MNLNVWLNKTKKKNDIQLPKKSSSTKIKTDGTPLI